MKVQESDDNYGVVTLGYRHHMSSLVIDMETGDQYHYKWGI